MTNENSNGHRLREVKLKCRGKGCGIIYDFVGLCCPECSGGNWEKVTVPIDYPISPMRFLAPTKEEQLGRK